MIFPVRFGAARVSEIREAMQANGGQLKVNDSASGESYDIVNINRECREVPPEYSFTTAEGDKTPRYKSTYTDPKSMNTLNCGEDFVIEELDIAEGQELKVTKDNQAKIREERRRRATGDAVRGLTLGH